MLLSADRWFGCYPVYSEAVKSGADLLFRVCGVMKFARLTVFDDGSCDRIPAQRRPESGRPLFIRGLLQSQRNRLSELPGRHPAAPGKRNPHRVRRTPPASQEASGIMLQTQANTLPFSARHVAGWALRGRTKITFPSFHSRGCFSANLLVA